MKDCFVGKVDNIKDSSEIVHAALALVVQLCRNIVSEKICMNDLEKCRRSALQLPALCDAANSGNVSLCPSFDQVKNAMELCSKKFTYVMKYRQTMEVVVKHCSKISKGT